MTICSGRLGRSDGAWDIHIPAQKDSAGGKIAGQFKCAQSVAFPSQMRLFYKLWVNYKLVEVIKLVCYNFLSICLLIFAAN